MGIAIQIVEEDLRTVVSYQGGIDINDDYYTFRAIAKEMKLPITSTIDDCGDTVINKPQLEILKKEIQQLRARADVSKAILDTLQKTIDAVVLYKYEYIKFMGD